MKKLIIIAILMAPLTTYAVWWNPSTWGQKAQLIDITPSPTSSVIEKIVEIPVEKIVEKPVEKIVTKTITDPKLKSQIDELTKEVELLKTQVASSQSDYQSCMVRLTKFQADADDATSLGSIQSKAKEQQIKQINVELAKLDVLSSRIKAYNTEQDDPTLVEDVNNAKKTNGDNIFRKFDAPFGAVIFPYKYISTKGPLIQMIDIYRSELKAELAKLQ